MDKNIADISLLLNRKNRLNEAYNNIANSTINKQRQQDLEQKEQNSKVTSGFSNSAVNNAIVKNVITTDIGNQKVLFAIEDLMKKYPGYSDGLKDIRTKGTVVITSDNTEKYPFRTINSSQDDTMTYVKSDPDKPDITDTVSATVTSDRFDINSLYDSTNNIDLYGKKYHDTVTGKQISTNNIVSFSDEGIITRLSLGTANNLPSYKLMPSDQIEQDTIVNMTENITPYTFKDKIKGHELFHEQALGDSVKSTKNIMYKYAYCLDNVIIQQRAVAPCAGFLSKPVSVSNTSYIELVVENVDGTEYYVIDGSEEVPILPKDTIQIIDEKLFFGMMPRFVIMNPDNITVKCNGIMTGINTQHDLELFLMTKTSENKNGESSYKDDNIYTVSYQPSEEARRYFPKTNSIRIKVIQRNLFDKIPKLIGNIKLLHYKVSQPWNLNKTDIDYDGTEQRFKAVRTWNT